MTREERVIPDRVVRIELISYFSTYPETEATSTSMAELLNRDHGQVERQMAHLAELRILEKKREEGNHVLYGYLEPLSTEHAAGRFGGRIARSIRSNILTPEHGGVETEETGDSVNGEASPPRSRMTISAL